MLRFLLTTFLLICGVLTTTHLSAQTPGYTYTLNGNPINTTNWILGGDAVVSGDQINLTANAMTQKGYIYYSIPVELAGTCTYFSVQFDYKIETVPGVPPADGLTFFYITNPPTGFGTGNTIGLPSPLNGMSLILDTYDNNSTPDNPLISLRSFNNSDYIEGSTAGLIANDLTNQNFIIDGTWHTCKIEYQNGIVKVFLDGSSTPSMEGPINLSMIGYFGFTASTGLYYEQHSIKNVVISGGSAPDNLLVTNQSSCVGESWQPINFGGTISNGIIYWYEDFANPSGSGSLVPPTIPTNFPGTYTYYVTQSFSDCALESQKVPITFTVNPNPDLIVDTQNIILCRNQSINVNITGANTYTWTPQTGVDNSFSGSVRLSPIDDVNYLVEGTTNKGCKSTINVKVNVQPVYEWTEVVFINEGEDYEFYDQFLRLPGIYKFNFPTEFGCDSIMNLDLRIIPIDKQVFITNAFTPNNDGKNDYFRVLTNAVNFVKVISLKVFNRYGQQVFDAMGDQAYKGWDGKFNGKDLEAGVYYYTVEYELEKDKRVKQAGDISLIR